jgi:hypothetical protein
MEANQSNNRVRRKAADFGFTRNQTVIPYYHQLCEFLNYICVFISYHTWKGLKR